MKPILPRLRNLLAMLASEADPLSVSDAANRLRVSKRTIFRELANVGPVLEPYGLEVSSKPGEGVTLEGPSQARKNLREDLEKLDHSDPADRRDRQDKLVLALFQTPGQKLATYAERFRVSAPTVSHDLDDVEPWLRARGLTLTRKAGTGISVSGDEMAVRRTILTLQQRLKTPYAYPHPDILLDLRDLAPELEPSLDWITPQSRDSLNRYMAVLVQRVMDGCVLQSAEGEAEEYGETADRLATVLGEAFNITIGRAEKTALAVELAACRPAIPQERGKDADAPLEALAAEMATLFDAERAPLLKMDEVLISGLVSHLRTALVRIRHKIELVDPMRVQITETYPDIMRRCRKACEALLPYGDWLPDDEVSLIAAHFGAATLRLAEREDRRKTVRVGVICVHGVGSSYLLASQVKKAFASRVLVEVGWHGDREKWRQYDMLVSTTELPDAAMPVVVVPPILGERDIRRIEAALAGQSADRVVDDVTPTAFIDELRTMEELVASVRNVLEDFSLATVPAAIDFAGLAESAGRHFGKTPGEAESISRGLIAREAISTQTIPQLQIVLLHCRAEGVGAPRFGVMRPDGAAFSGPSFGSARCAVVMTLPAAASREQSEMMGCLSAALIEQEHFLNMVKAGDGLAVARELRRILGAFLFQFSMQKLKG